MFWRRRNWEEEEEQKEPEVIEHIPTVPAVENPRTAVEWSASGLITEDGAGGLGARWNSKQELAIIKKEIRLRQKAFRLEKRLVSSEMTAIRTAYRQKTASRGPSLRGGGNVGKVFRTINQLSRASDRSNRENALAPLERRKAELDYYISQLDQFLIQIELRDLEGE